MLIEPILYHVFIELYHKILKIFCLLELGQEQPVEHIVTLFVYLYHIDHAHLRSSVLIFYCYEPHSL